MGDVDISSVVSLIGVTSKSEPGSRKLEYELKNRRLGDETSFSATTKWREQPVDRAMAVEDVPIDSRNPEEAARATLRAVADVDRNILNNPFVIGGRKMRRYVGRSKSTIGTVYLKRTNDDK